MDGLGQHALSWQRRSAGMLSLRGTRDKGPGTACSRTGRHFSLITSRSHPSLLSSMTAAGWKFVGPEMTLRQAANPSRTGFKVPAAVVCLATEAS
jgi:hypothetical protein